VTSKCRWRAAARHVRRGCVLSGAFLAAGIAFAQDPFEIHVLEYEDLHPGDFTIEVHSNYAEKGTTVMQGPAAATQDGTHMTLEVTGAVVPEFSFGIMQLNERLRGSPPQAAGWRLVPHFYAPAGWRLPVQVGLTAEFSFEKVRREGSMRSVEILPIVEKQFGRWKVDLNPTVEKVLHGVDPDRGWHFGLAARAAYERMRHFTPSFEYYSDLGALPLLPPVHSQVHQIVPGGDLHLAKNLTWNVGVGFGLTSSGDRLLYKSRLEISWGGRH
jgi:hypothetical protein